MSDSNLRKTIALGLVAILLLVEFSMFYDFFYPFRFLWNQGKIIEFSLSLILFFWSLLGAFLIIFSGRSLFRKVTLPIFLFFFLLILVPYRSQSHLLVSKLQSRLWRIFNGGFGKWLRLLA